MEDGREVKYRGADKPLARSGTTQARKHIRDARVFNNIETRAVIKFVFLQGKAPKDIHAILTETLACFLPGQPKELSASWFSTGRAKDLSTPAIVMVRVRTYQQLVQYWSG